MLVLRSFPVREYPSTIRFTYGMGRNVNRIASLFSVPNKERVLYQFQISDENPLNIFLDPRFDVRVEDLHSPELLSTCAVSGYYVLISPITVC
jgi:hypothetical protein